MTSLALMTEEEVANFGRVEDAGFGALRCERGLLPLAAMDVDVRVTGVVASIELAQTFKNTTGGPIEATYIFPLPDRMAVNRFRMEVAGRVIEGVIDERGAAREQYDEAIAAGHRAAITEEERPDVFTLRVGNLLAGEAATVRLSLVGPLPIDDGEVTFRFPLVVAPRYIPGAALGGEQAGLGLAEDTTLVPDASRISPPVRLPGMPNPVRLGIRVALEDRAIRDVASSLHSTTSTVRDAQIVELRGGERLDRDFILRWHIDAAELRTTLVCADDADGKAGTFALTLVPPSTAAVSAKPRDVVFVIDRSGSMQGWKMTAARRATARMVDTLTSRDRFCVLAFDNSVDALPEANLVAASDRNRFRAVEQLAKIDARGGTELAQPLARALSQLAGGHDDRERVVVLVTDGQVGNEDHILHELAPAVKNVRMFTLGIDQAVNAAFLRRLAGAGGGLCELVESEDRLDAVMAKVHHRIGTPIATELALSPKGLDIDRASIAPKKLPDVYAGAPVVILGRYRGAAPSNASIDLDATSFGDPFHAAVAREVHPAGAWLAASWARAHIRELEDRYAAGEQEHETDIVAVSKRFGVLSRFTAFLAVDRSEIANKGGKLHQIVQPVDSPAGWEASAAPSGSFQPMHAMMPMGMGGATSTPPSFMPPPAPKPAPAPYAAVMKAREVSVEDKKISRSVGAPMASPPPAPPSAQSQHRLSQAPRREKAKAEVAMPPPTPDAYLAKLAVLAHELDTKARETQLAKPALRLLRQRLSEWVEDARSVGHGDLADAVDHLVKRLAAALVIGDQLATEALAVAVELAKLAAGTPPSPGAKKSRLAFWK
jgi:Ca-activated chloride channel family protein